MKRSIPLKCAVCNTDIFLDILDPQIINTPRVGMVLIEHPEPVTCPQCKRTMAVAIQTVGNLTLCTAEAPPDTSSPLVLACAAMPQSKLTS
jgi:hypothetical protein